MRTLVSANTLYPSAFSRWFPTPVSVVLFLSSLSVEGICGLRLSVPARQLLVLKDQAIAYLVICGLIILGIVPCSGMEGVVR